ncbi:MAG: lysylphosphatidylglycerol synthase domain-containing protein, partial [Fervidicoccaceae archaeon]|nr:lysylphosphatidylglycerol synthase domain-containing protein [Fervidicoccaceae archaeon]
MKKEAVIVFQLLFVVLVLAVMYVVSGISPGELKELLVSRFFLAFIVVMLLVEILRGLRLKIVTEYLLKDNKLSVSSFVLSRLVGNLAGLFTPSSFGTVPAQAVALSSRHPYPIEKFIGSGLITSMVDA